MNVFKKLLAETKPVIGMVHLGALPGAPLYDASGGLEALVRAAAHDLKALQDAGVDAVMFGNENDRPYQLRVDPAATAAVSYIIGRLRPSLRVPFGVNLLWDPMASIAAAAAAGADFAREIFTGVYASDMGVWAPSAAEALRYRAALGRPDLALLFNISAEFAATLDSRALADRARSAVFSSLPDAVLVSGPITGEAAALADLIAVKQAVPGTPVLANTGVRRETLSDVLAVADGCVVGTALKVDGDTWKPVDPVRAAEFMACARAARGA